MMASGETIESYVPSRLDGLPWSRWHWLIVVALGATWILDGLEVTLAGALGGILTRPDTLGLTPVEVGASATYYLTGAVIGALLFGYGADRFGRKKFFFITVAVYLFGTALSAFSWNFASYAIFRALTGAGIGGEYAAINSAIDELIPARVRGRVDLMINGSFWLGTALGGLLSVPLLNPDLFSASTGWRLSFGLGAVLALGILIVRRYVPESPRWMFIHGREEEAERLVSSIEHDVAEDTGQELRDPHKSITVRQRRSIGFGVIAKTVFRLYPQRTVLGFSLFIGQAFLYNAVFFTQALVLDKFYGVSAQSVGWYIIPFAIGNFAGPLVLGSLFDTVGRKPMIAGTYIVSGVLLWITAFLFDAGSLNATTLTIAWCVIFFFASAGASAAYLTVSEIFPMETRAMAIAFFYAIGTAVGGITGPLLFGKLIATGHETPVFWGFALGAAVMIIGGIVQAIWGIAAEQRSLE